MKKLDEYTFRLVMDSTINLLQVARQPQPEAVVKPDDNMALKQCTANLLNFSSAMFKVLLFIKVNHPVAYQELKQQPTVDTEWYRILRSHIAQFERDNAHSNKKGS